MPVMLCNQNFNRFNSNVDSLRFAKQFKRLKRTIRSPIAYIHTCIVQIKHQGVDYADISNTNQRKCKPYSVCTSIFNFTFEHEIWARGALDWSVFVAVSAASVLFWDHIWVTVSGSWQDSCVFLLPLRHHVYRGSTTPRVCCQFAFPAQIPSCNPHAAQLYTHTQVFTAWYSLAQLLVQLIFVREARTCSRGHVFPFRTQTRFMNNETSLIRRVGASGIFTSTLRSKKARYVLKWQVNGE